MTAVAELEHASVDRGGRRVLHDLTLHVAVQEVLAVLGPNGAGKSTLVRALVGLQPLATGSAQLFGVPLRRFRDWHRVGWVPQRTTATAGVPATVREVVATGRLSRSRRGRRMRPADAAAVNHALDVVRLEGSSGRSVGALSGGQQQRVLIARALAGEPDLLVLDEPTAGVDAESQDAFASALQHLADRGTTVVLVAHELGPLAPLVSRAVVLVDGRVTHEGSPPPADPHHDHPGHDHVHPHADDHGARLLDDLWGRS